MIRLLGTPKTLCNGVTRRDLLQIGGLSALGIQLFHGLNQRVAFGNGSKSLHNFGKAKSCILIYKYGG